MITPPPPPRRGDGFVFLNAVYPPDEAARLEYCAKYESIWDNDEEFDKVGQQVAKALKHFEVTKGSLSFFDKFYERIQIEKGYNSDVIPRHSSIAAHALYSTDVMVVLDTQKVCAPLSLEVLLADVPGLAL